MKNNRIICADLLLEQHVCVTLEQDIIITAWDFTGNREGWTPTILYIESHGSNPSYLEKKKNTNITITQIFIHIR